MTIEMYMKQGCRPAKATYAQAAGYRIDKVNWKFIVYREDGSEYRYTQNFDDVGILLIDGKVIPQCYWYDYEISKRSIAAIRYCEADVQATFDLYRRKVEQNMKEKTYNVLFILYNDGEHEYFDLDEYTYTIVNRFGNDCDCIRLAKSNVGGEDTVIYIKMSSVNSYIVAKRNPDESCLSAIPEWFEEKIDKVWKKNHCNKEDVTMPERNVQELLEEFDTEELVEEVKRRKEDEKWYNRFEHGMYYKVRDMRKEDSAFVILRFIGYDKDYDEFAQFENVYDHYMLWVPNPKLRRCNIDNYTITKLRDGMATVS